MLLACLLLLRVCVIGVRCVCVLGERVLSGFNVYTDSDVGEVQLAFVHVQGLAERLAALAEEHENHPTLLYLQRLTAGLLRLPIATTPLMKILLGLEMVVDKAVDWDRAAHQGIKLTDHVKVCSPNPKYMHTVRILPVLFPNTVPGEGRSKEQ